jgi:hypothetical protein
MLKKALGDESVMVCFFQRPNFVGYSFLNCSTIAFNKFFVIQQQFSVQFVEIGGKIEIIHAHISPPTK